MWQDVLNMGESKNLILRSEILWGGNIIFYENIFEMVKNYILKEFVLAYSLFIGYILELLKMLRGQSPHLAFP